jgi:heme exporter protein C
MTTPPLAAPAYAAPAALRAPAAPLALPKAGFDWLLALGVLALAAVMARAVWFTPADAMQGPAQKIFYVHVPTVIVGLYLALPLVAIASGVYLWLKDDRLDRLAESAARWRSCS